MMKCGPMGGRHPSFEEPCRTSNQYTCTSAGMDLALALVEEDLGSEVALAVARDRVIFFKRPGGQSSVQPVIGGLGIDSKATAGACRLGTKTYRSKI
jgi:transcriptional regulator GlxA family with amidase domain